jgi:hypothetical protein
MRQQRVDILGFGGGQAREDVAQVRVWVDAVRHGRLNQPIPDLVTMSGSLHDATNLVTIPNA